MTSNTNPTKITTEPGLPFVDVVREFDAPVADLFKAHVDPDLFSRWVGPKGLEMEEINFDIRNGGTYRFVHGDKDGSYAFRGTVHTVVPNELLIQTFEYEGWPNGVSLDYYHFEDLGNGRSRLTTHSILPSLEALEGMLESGMEHGVTDGYEKLDELLAEGV